MGYQSDHAGKLGLVPSWRPIVNADPGEPTVGGRLLGALAGAALIGLFAMGSAISFFGLVVYAQVPDARVPDGDPCCPHPDTWWAAIGGATSGVVALAACTAALSAAIALIYWSLLGRRMTNRRALRPGAISAVLVYALAVAITVIDYQQ